MRRINSSRDEGTLRLLLLYVNNAFLLKSQDPELEEKRKKELARIKKEKKKFKGRVKEAIQKKKEKMLKQRAKCKKAPEQTVPGPS